MKQIICSITALFFFCFIFCSCIPSQPTPQKPPEMAEPVTSSVPTPPPEIPSEQKPISGTETKSDTTIAKQPSETSTPTDKKAHATVRFGVAGAGFPFSIQQTPLVGQEGFSIKGSFGLSGIITRPDPTKDLWVFSGQFELPSEDYKIGEVTYDVLNAPIEYYTQKKPLPPNLIPQVMITIPVKLPPNAKDEKGDVKVSFRLEIPVSAKAQFLFTLVDKSS
ncbi:MAG TPA: hypothetical protein PLA12_04025 [Candidatus Hydrogenedens sp.]|nr:hypothetical protein [Candidatus Hydrogenedens sp.]